MMFEEGCFICGKATTGGGLYCSDACRAQDSPALSNHSSDHSSRPISDQGLYADHDVPALSPYQTAMDPDSDVPEHYLGESAIRDYTPSTSPTSSLVTEDDEEDLIVTRRHGAALVKSLPSDMSTFERQRQQSTTRSYQRILNNYQRPAPPPAHPNLAVPTSPKISHYNNLQFNRVPAKVAGLTPAKTPKDRTVSDSSHRIASMNGSPSRRHSFPTLLNLGIQLPSPQPSPHLRPATRSSRPCLGLVARHSSSSHAARPKLRISSRHATTFPPSPTTPKVPQTEAQAIAAAHRAKDAAARSRTPAPRDADGDLTTPTQAREPPRGRSRQRMLPGERSRSRSRSRSGSRSRGLTAAVEKLDVIGGKPEHRRGSRGLLPAFGIGALRREGDLSLERDEFRGRRGRAP